MKKQRPKLVSISERSEEALINNVIYMENKAHRRRAIYFGACLILFFMATMGFMVFLFSIIPGVVNLWYGV